MKKIIVAVVVLVLVLAAAPWGMGRIAQSRIDKGFESMVKKAGYIRIVETKWSRGWFHSEQLVTFEFVLPTGRPRVPVAMSEETEPQVADDPVVEQIPNAPPSAAPEPIRVSLQSEVLHGPVLGSSGIGLARLKSGFVLSEEIRARLIELVGTDEPVEVVTRLGLVGGATTKISGEARSIPLGKLAPDQVGTIEWDAFQLTMSLSRGARSYDMDGKMPRIEVRNENSGAHALFTDLTMDGKGTRITDDLYDGGGRVAVGRMLFEGTRTPKVEIEKFEYGVVGAKQDDFMDFALTTGSGAVKSAPMEAMGIELKEAHFDVTAGHLHIETLQQLIVAMRETNAAILDGTADPEATLEPFQEHGVALVKHDPELTIERINVVTPQGEALIKGSVKLQGITDEDLAMGVLALPQKLVADITIEVAQELVEKFPNGATLSGAAIDAGYFKREGTKLVSHIEYRQGALLVNGKTPELPGNLRLPGVPEAAPAQ